MPSLTFHQYGKTNVRLTQVLRSTARHEIAELSVNILFHGEFETSYTEGDNSLVLPTDTMKNTVYVLARQHPIVSIEDFAIRLAKHFLGRVPHLSGVQITIEQTPWARISDHDSAFLLSGKERRVAKIFTTKSGEEVTSGFHGLEILKTGNSAFAGFLKDEFTTLPEVRDRLLGTILDAKWRYGLQELDFQAEYDRVRSVLLDTFADHVSESVQHTLYDMAAAALKSSTSLAEVHLVMPNKHRILADLSRFGLDNPNQVFIPTEEPSGYIEARVRADHVS